MQAARGRAAPGRRQGSRPRGRASAWWAGRARWRASAATWTRRTGHRTSMPGHARGSGALRAPGAVRPPARAHAAGRHAARPCPTGCRDAPEAGQALFSKSFRAHTHHDPWSACQGLWVKSTRRRRQVFQPRSSAAPACRRSGMTMFSRSAALALPKSNSLELQSLTRHPGSIASTTTCARALTLCPHTLPYVRARQRPRRRRLKVPPAGWAARGGGRWGHRRRRGAREPAACARGSAGGRAPAQSSRRRRAAAGA